MIYDRNNRQQIILITFTNRWRWVFDTCRMMAEEDIDRVVPLYIEHYNNYEGGEWTQQTTYKRIHQVWSREDSLCMMGVISSS